MQLSFKAILFDLGGVLIDIDYLATENAFKKLGASQFESYYTQFAQNQIFDRFECGEISPQHFVNLLLPYTLAGTTPNQVVAAWNQMIGSFPRQKIELLSRLSKLYPLYMLSNTNALHWVEVQREWQKATPQPTSTYFTQMFLSHQIQMRKPHADTFLWVCEQMGFEPKDVLFIDDSPQHIDGAKQEGLQTFYYQNAADFYAFFS